jgi:UDP-glucose 4-epimerase
LNILVTGGAGFIGSHIVEYNLSQGHHVHVIDNLSSGTRENLSFCRDNPNFTFFEDDIITWSGLHGAVQWADVVYHMAAIVGVRRVLANPIGMIENNIGSCMHLFRTIAETKAKPRVMLASSSMVYGDTNKSNLNEKDLLSIKSITQGHWAYAVSKLANETIGFSYYRSKKIPITIMRIFNTVGPRQSGRYGMVMPNFIEQACTNKNITVFGDGKQTRSFCDVRDMVKIIYDLANNDKSIGEIVNVGNSELITIFELAELIKDCAKSESSIEYVSYQKAYGEDFIEIMSRAPDLNKMHKLSHVHYEWPLQATIHDLITQFKQTH